MEDKGKYRIFDSSRIRSYPLRQRRNKVQAEDLVDPSKLGGRNFSLDAESQRHIAKLAEEVVKARQENKPVVVFSGAHLIKNGLGPLLVDLVERGLVSLVAGNGATAIHDFELALIGATAEVVPDALGKGEFGMAYEFAYINEAIRMGGQMKLGLGEALGKMICCQEFREMVFAELGQSEGPKEFGFARTSLLGRCYQKDVPFTVHVGIGTDVIDQHPSFDPAAKGECSGRDFLIFSQQMCRFTEGGVFLNIGSAVTGPEVLLKAVAMAANVGCKPKGLITADFDLRAFDPARMSDESSPYYYNRDQKGVVTRVPQAFDGHGFYVQGNQVQTVPALYSEILKRL